MTDEEDPLRFRRELEKARMLDTSDARTEDRPENVEWMEPTEDARVLEMDNVRETIKVQGYDLADPRAPSPDAESKALERADPTADYKRNKKEYSVLCPVCLGSRKCIRCKGRGRVKLIFRCKDCSGKGRCPACDRDMTTPCPKCGAPLSKFTDKCRSCGAFFACRSCGSNLPSMATRCMVCKAEFKCKSCRKPYPRSLSPRCPHCLHWNGQG